MPSMSAPISFFRTSHQRQTSCAAHDSRLATTGPRSCSYWSPLQSRDQRLASQRRLQQELFCLSPQLRGFLNGPALWDQEHSCSAHHKRPTAQQLINPIFRRTRPPKLEELSRCVGGWLTAGGWCGQSPGGHCLGRMQRYPSDLPRLPR